MELPIGSIICYPSAICPEGFMPCDGREFSKQACPKLCAVIKNTWGETDMAFSYQTFKKSLLVAGAKMKVLILKEYLNRNRLIY